MTEQRRDFKFYCGWLTRGKYRHFLAEAQFMDQIRGFREIKSLTKSMFVVDGATDWFCGLMMDEMGMLPALKYQILARHNQYFVGLGRL